MLWNASLECGIPAIDEQHKELFRQVGSLLDLSNKGRVGELFGFLEQYVVKHFSTEEIMHKQTLYPKTVAHKKIHDDFIKVFLSLRKEYEESGESVAVLVKINKLAFAWLTEHIMGHDKDFALFYKALPQR